MAWREILFRNLDWTAVGNNSPLLLPDSTSCSRPEMPSPQKQQTESNFPAQPRNSGGGQQRIHRGGRGRGRGQRRTGQISQTSSPPGAAALPEPKTATVSSAISQAVEEVTQIVESLKQVLEQMEEVLELVELAERQKSADEREIESLRHALRKIQQPRSRQQERPRPDD